MPDTEVEIVPSPLLQTTDEALAALSAPADDATQRLTALIESAALGAPPPESMDTVTFRNLSDAANRATATHCDDAQERVAKGPQGEFPIRVFMPPAPTSAYLYIHGGAWILGGRDLADQIMWARAQRADTAVVSIDYRLAPEHRWPAAGDDCEAAGLWFVDWAADELGTDRLIIGGESAGAHLSAVTLLRLRDRHGLAPFCGAELRYGMYDLRLAPAARLYSGPLLNAATLRWVLDHAFDPDQRETADASPMLADLRGLPPALFTVGTADSLVDDSVLMWARWRAAGNDASLQVYPGSTHAFDYAPTPAADRVIDQSVAFIDSCVAGSTLAKSIS